MRIILSQLFYAKLSLESQDHGAYCTGPDILLLQTFCRGKVWGFHLSLNFSPPPPHHFKTSHEQVWFWIWVLKSTPIPKLKLLMKNFIFGYESWKYTLLQNWNLLWRKLFLDLSPNNTSPTKNENISSKIWIWIWVLKNTPLRSSNFSWRT